MSDTNADRPAVGPFGSVDATSAQLVTMRQFDAAFAQLYRAVEAQAPVGRYASLALKALEEAAMWCTKAILRTPE